MQVFMWVVSYLSLSLLHSVNTASMVDGHLSSMSLVRCMVTCPVYSYWLTKLSSNTLLKGEIWLNLNICYNYCISSVVRISIRNWKVQSSLPTLSPLDSLGTTGSARLVPPFIFWQLSNYLDPGCTGILWLFLWILVGYISPATHPCISEEERLYIEESIAAQEHEDKVHLFRISWHNIICIDLSSGPLS